MTLEELIKNTGSRTPLLGDLHSRSLGWNCDPPGLGLQHFTSLAYAVDFKSVVSNNTEKNPVKIKSFKNFPSWPFFYFQKHELDAYKVRETFCYGISQ